MTHSSDDGTENVIIARDGVEIGTWRQNNLQKAARASVLRPTDYYWQDGMPDWLLLESLLGPEAWQPEEPRMEPPPAKSLPELLREPRSRVIGGVSAAILLLIAIGAYAVHANRVREARANQARAAAESTKAETRDVQLRDKAAGELRAKIEKLPAVPTSSSNVFYYGFRISMMSTADPEVPWVVTIRGGEDVLDPVTRQTAWRSDFTLETDYRNREWTFKSYHAKPRT